MQYQLDADRRVIERERHLRVVWYAAVAFALAAGAYFFLDFDRAQALGYAVSCFVMLNVVNFRTLFRRLPSDSRR